MKILILVASIIALLLIFVPMILLLFTDNVRIEKRLLVILGVTMTICLFCDVCCANAALLRVFRWLQSLICH